MKQRTRHAILYGLTVTVCILAGLDSLFWRVDPAGKVRYLWDYYHLQQHAIPVPHGLVYIPGTYALNLYTVKIDENGFRAVQGSKSGDCTIAFIGDSLTFGIGSDTTFADLLAPDIPARVINAGIPGYNIDNIVRVPDSVPADGYVWLSFFNDGDAPLVWSIPDTPPPPALKLYFDYYFPAGSGAAPNADHFRQAGAALMSRGDVLIFAFEDMPLSDIVAEHDGHLIPYYTSMASTFDGHPDETGHTQIAAAMHDAVLVFTEKQCK